eukprot:1159876-Pelagomonas_calceolata.AAC.1
MTHGPRQPHSLEARDVLGQLVQVAVCDEHCIKHAMPAVHHVVIHMNEHKSRVSDDASELAGKEGPKVLVCSGVYSSQQALCDLHQARWWCEFGS